MLIGPQLRIERRDPGRMMHRQRNSRHVALPGGV
jgi:hypothetical protein